MGNLSSSQLKVATHTHSYDEVGISAGQNITIDNGEISAVDTTYTAGNGLSLSNGEFSADTTVLQEKLTAGTNIDITNNTISATDTTYTAGTGLTLNGTQFAVDTTTIATKADIANLSSFTVVDTLPAVATADTHTIYLKGPIGSGADKYEEWIVTETQAGFVSDSPITHISINEEVSGDESYYWNGDDTEDPITNVYVGINNYTPGEDVETELWDDANSVTIYLDEETFPYVYYSGARYINGKPVIIASKQSTGTSSVAMDLYYSDSQISWNAGGRQWTKIGETSVDLSGYATTTALTNGLATKADTSDVLTKTNTTAYTPSADYNPATKKYADGKVSKGANALSQGETSLFSINDDYWQTTFGAEIVATHEADANTHFESGFNPYGVYSELTASGNRVSTGIEYSGLTMRDDGNDIITSITPSMIQYHNQGQDWETNSFYFGGGGSNQIARLQDLSGKQDKATSGSTAPSTTPSYVGQQYIDTTADKMYVATGTSSSSDWTEVGAGSGDMLYADYGWTTLTGATVTLALRSEITPSANFTVNKPNDLKDGQFYVLRVDNGATAYTMALGTGVTNPYSEDLTLVANNVQQFMFLAKGGNLELQPSTEIDLSNYLAKNNTTSYTPSGDYNPATKKYVDDNKGKNDIVSSPSAPSDHLVIWQDLGYYDWKLYNNSESSFLPIMQYKKGSTAPSDYGMLWYDDNNYQWKAYNFSTYAWEPIVTNISGKQDKATSGSTAPSTTPSYIGQQYVDTTNDTLYVATGTSSSSDWTEVGAGGGGNVIAMTQQEYDLLSTAEKNDGKLRIITDAPTEDISIEWSNIANKPSDLTAAQIQAGSSTTSGTVAPSVIAASMPILSTQTGNIASLKIWVGTQAAYEALSGSYDANTLYFTTTTVS